jgi:hypothetical protein
MSKGNISKENRRKAVQAMRAAQARRRRRRRWLAAIGAALAAVGLAAGITVAASGGGTGAAANAQPLALSPLSTLGTLKPAPAPGAMGPESVPIPSAAPLTGTSTAATGQPVDGIGCSTGEQTLFHIHAHLTIFLNGSPRQVPAAIGIPGAQAQNTPAGPFVGTGNCFYWLHTHAADGIIHTESPVQRSYTLGNFFDEWGQPLGPDHVGPAHGKVTAIYNGQVFRGSPRDIPLTAHAQIQLDVGTPLVAPESIAWPSGL